MKTKLIIGLFVLVCGISYGFTHAYAKKDESKEPASHMWIRTGNAVVYVPLKWLQDCEMLTKQAAAINSSEAHCYYGPNLLKKVTCQKSPTSNKPNCN